MCFVIAPNPTHRPPACVSECARYDQGDSNSVSLRIDLIQHVLVNSQWLYRSVSKHSIHTYCPTTELYMSAMESVLNRHVASHLSMTDHEVPWLPDHQCIIISAMNENKTTS